MKKNLFFTMLILFFSCIFTVSATTIFKYDWKTENEYLRADYTMYYNNNTYYNKGYITSTINLEDQDSEGIPKTYLRRYNIQGELQTTKTLENKMILSLTSNNQYIIALSITYGDSTDTYKILLLDESLGIQKEITINMEDNENIFNILEEFKILGIKFLTKIDNNIYFATSNYIKEINIETGKTINYEPTDENIQKYMNYLYRLSEEKTDTRYFFGHDKNTTYEVLTGMENQGCISTPVSKEVGGTLEDSLLSRYPIFTDAFITPYVACNPDYKAVIKLYKNDELVFDKIYEEYSTFNSPYIINDYIVAIATKIDYDTYEYSISIVIFDMEGNLLQEISEEEYYINLVPGPASFMTIGVNQSTNDRCYTEEKEISYNCFKNNNIVYYLPLTITTKIEGNGIIEVPNTARFEELIKYYPNPEENYSLDSLTIIDSENNQITPSNNTFTMPSNNVTIIARFGIANPDTKDISVIGIIIVLSISILIFTKYSNRLKEK